MGLRLGGIGVCVVLVAVSAVASGAVAASGANSAFCEDRRGYGPNDNPPRFYNYFTTPAGAKRHIKQSTALLRVLFPSFTYPDATVYIRFDTHSSGWKANLAFHAGCDASGQEEEDSGELGWEISSDTRLGGIACGNGGLGCFAKKRLNLGGRMVTRLTPRTGSEKHSFYTFTSGGLTYWVNGQRPRSPGYTPAQHDHWVESRIRTARRVG